MKIDEFLSRLEGVKPTGPGRWVAECPAHADKTPSLSIRETDDRRILIHDFGGCPTGAVLVAVGVEISDLFPDAPTIANPERRPFPAADVLRALNHEALVVGAAAGVMLEGRPLSDPDRNRLALALGRIQDAVTLSGVSRHG